MLYVQLPPILGENLEITNINSCLFLNLNCLNGTSCKRSMYLWLGLSEKRYRYSVVYTLIIYWDRSIADPFSLIKIIYQIGREYIIDVEIDDFPLEVAYSHFIIENSFIYNKLIRFFDLKNY
jgi:hypothetical protein